MPLLYIHYIANIDIIDQSTVDHAFMSKFLMIQHLHYFKMHFLSWIAEIPVLRNETIVFMSTAIRILACVQLVAWVQMMVVRIHLSVYISAIIQGSAKPDSYPAKTWHLE